MALYNYLEQSGSILVDTSEIKAESDQVWMDISGASTAPDASTVEGRLVSGLLINPKTAIARNNAELANQINPDLAFGVFFDSIYALMGGQRDASESSFWDLVCTGIPGTTITDKSTIQDESDNLWISSGDAVIGADGQVTVSFESQNTGPITGAAGADLKIIKTTLGWETVTAAVNATPGKNEQSLVSAKYDRRVEIGANSKSTAYSVMAAVNQLDGVLGVQFRENFESSQQVIDGITMPPKSTWLCVDGGSLSEISGAYVTNRFGTSFFGFSQTEAGSFTDPLSGQSYSPDIDRPTIQDIDIEVTARLSSSSSTVRHVKDAVLLWASGDVEGYTGARLGNGISPFEIAGALNQTLSPSRVFVSSVQVALSGGALSSATIPINPWEKAGVDEVNVTVVIV